MTEERPSVVQPGRTGAPEGEGRAACGTGQERPAIVIVGRDVSVRKALSEELSGRYGAVGDGAITIPLVHRYLAGNAMPAAGAR